MSENLDPTIRETNTTENSDRQQSNLALRVLKWGALPVLAGAAAYFAADQYTDWAKQTSKPLDMELVEYYGPKVKVAATATAILVVGGLEYLAHRLYSRRKQN